MLNWVEKHPENVILLRGNHEEEFSYCIELMKMMFGKRSLTLESLENTKYVYELIKEIASDTGMAPFDYYGTIGKLIHENSVCMEQLDKWNECIRKLPFVFKEEINGRMCVVVHAGYLESLDEVEMEDHFDTLEDFYLYARDDAYIYGGIRHGVVVAGHTPTILEEELPYNDGNVYMSYDEDLDCIFYNIDCGCAYRSRKKNAKLACIRLEDEKIFYV